jgi:hypothetical protein
VSLIVGITYLARAIVCFFISVNVFKNIYPTFVHINIWDSCAFFFNEMLCSFVIGYTRNRDDRVKTYEKFNETHHDFNKNYGNLVTVTKGVNKHDILYDLQDPLLDQYEREKDI